MFEYQVSDRKFKPKVKRSSNSFLFSYPGINFYESTPYVVTFPRGRYKIECWGSMSTSGDAGAYTAGDLDVKNTIALYLYIGSYSKTSNQNLSTYNGGGAGSPAGGGATDIRLFPGKWDDFLSLKSRIMVAAGSGSSDCDGIGGIAGGINGSDAGSSYAAGKGATQTKGGSGFVSGSFGKGGSYNISYEGKRPDYGAGAGSGYYGGGTGSVIGGCGAGGGSSFISGYEGCDAINESSTEDNIIHTHQSIHYSRIAFTNSIMKDGSATDMPLPKGNTGKGNNDQGYVRITLLTSVKIRYYSCRLTYSHSHHGILIYLILISK